MSPIKRMLDDQISSINYHKITSMATNIQQLQDDQFLVNGKLIYQDQNNNWISGEELTVFESRAFRQHLAAIQRGIVGKQNTGTPAR